MSPARHWVPMLRFGGFWRASKGDFGPRPGDHRLSPGVRRRPRSEPIRDSKQGSARTRSASFQDPHSPTATAAPDPAGGTECAAGSPRIVDRRPAPRDSHSPRSASYLAPGNGQRAVATPDPTQRRPPRHPGAGHSTGPRARAAWRPPLPSNPPIRRSGLTMIPTESRVIGIAVQLVTGRALKPSSVQGEAKRTRSPPRFRAFGRVQP